MGKIVNVMNAIRSPERSFLMIRDFNLPEIDWCGPYDNLVLTRRSGRAVAFVDAVAQCGLVQHVRQPIRGDNVLDLALTNMPVSQCEVDEGYFDSDHRHLPSRVLCPVRVLPLSPVPLL